MQYRTAYWVIVVGDVNSTLACVKWDGHVAERIVDVLLNQPVPESAVALA